MDCELNLLGSKVSKMDEYKRIRKLRDKFRRKYRTDDPNKFDEAANKTVFEKILRTPNSAADVDWCCKNGADLYTVSLSLRSFSQKLIKVLLCSVMRTRNFQLCKLWTHFARKT